jgi:hypothetical protein
VRAGLVAAAIAVGCLWPASALAQPQRFREDEITKPVSQFPPAVLLYTFGVGPVIFEKFGHSALCLDYRGEYPTVCFNYGVTNFGAGPKLVWGFIREEQKFWVEPVPLRALERFYKREDRSIWKQTLPLSEEQARHIEDRLWGDLDESRRYYIYDHFYDNCTTRLRDMIDETTGGALKKDTDMVFPRMFREFGFRGLAEFPLLLAISDFAVGRDLDKYPTLWEAMFLPDILRDEVARRYGAPAIVVNVRRGPPFPTSGSKGRGWVIALGFLFALPLVLARLVGRGERAARVWAILPLVFVGFVLWGTAIVSSIAGLRWNEALLMFIPLDLALFFLGERARQRYARIRVAMIVGVTLLVAVGIFRQPLWAPALFGFLPMLALAFDWPRRRSAAQSATGQIRDSRQAA